MVQTAGLTGLKSNQKENAMSEEIDNMMISQATTLLLEQERKIHELESQLSLANSQLQVANKNLAWCLKILEQADISKVSDKLHWANIISEARCFLDKKLSEGGGEKEPTAEECLEWLAHNPVMVALTFEGDYVVERIDDIEIDISGEGKTPLEAIRSAMKGDKSI